jgi:hypothetical protein
MVSSPRPYEPLTTGQLATLLGWTRARARRWLDGLAKHDPSVVLRVNGHRRITLASLRRVLPEFGKRFPSGNEVEELRYELAQQKAELYELAKEFAAFRKKSNEWYRSLAARMNGAENNLREKKKVSESAGMYRALQDNK